MPIKYTASDYLERKHPVNGKLIAGYFVLENGRPYQHVAYATKAEAEIQASATNTIRKVSR